MTVYIPFNSSYTLEKNSRSERLFFVPEYLVHIWMTKYDGLRKGVADVLQRREQWKQESAEEAAGIQ
ncbi:hypothetical protein DFO69_4120 [Bacillus subtilis]|nr:hypothetical protein DFO69_4120 [Bacillus subtilis]